MDRKLLLEIIKKKKVKLLSLFKYALSNGEVI